MTTAKLALVTGGAGFIGSTIARALIAQGTPVRVFDNLITGFREVVPPEAEFQLGDLRNAEEVAKACEGADVVFHQAALRSVAKSVDEPLATEESNVSGTINLLAAAQAAGVRRVVYASSSSAYGETTEGINREDAAPNPLSPYAVSKLAAEYYCRLWTRLHGLSTVSLRYFNVFGPGQHPESKYAALFPGLISALAAGRAPEVHWDGEQSRDFTFVDDVARANLLAASAGPQVDGQVFNIGAGRAKTVNETLTAVSQAMGVWIEPVRTPKRQGDVRSTLADISLARELLGWEPLAEWTGAVAATVKWFTEGTRPSAG
ncbi:MAG TPA: NAD-dependent epimerase/dehydratase family protein [Actinomycetota bacterium]|nr:NAD-dependent epimerase/dehydratase family protein [Actinomycetota bacterium]